MSERPPPYSWRRFDQKTWEAAAFLIVPTVLAVAFSFGLWRGSGVSYALAIIGTLLGVWAIFVAVAATEDSRQLHEVLADAKSALDDLQTTARSLSDLDRLDRLRRIQEPLERLSRGPALVVPVVPSRYPKPADKPLRCEEIWTQKADLEQALHFKGSLDLPACEALVSALNAVVLPLDAFGGRPPPTREEFRDLLFGAEIEVAALLPKL
ncbi:hypothetical protein [Miltoncostaea oceani]|uniref:hypothetical protein n=1 Tax=Miltoncostaea oceani TaxID=2843216 RepID=UPI001C3D4FDA|nr:hypothetical protein [Miltoncostaea oceani]